MAHIEKRVNKNGVTTYRITVSCGYDVTGKQIKKRMTYKPDSGMTKRQIEKELNIQASTFEERCRNGLVLDGNMKFADFSIQWLEDRKLNIKPKTYERYKSMLPRINSAIGHIKLCRLKPLHLRELYKNLSEGGIRKDNRYTATMDIDKYIKDNKLTSAEFSRITNIPPTTVKSLRKGNPVTKSNAEKLCKALNFDLSDIFQPLKVCSKPLSSKTVQHHHRLISVILETAVEWELILYNPARRTKPPKVEKKEANYIDEKQAKTLLRLLETADTTHRTFIRLLMFTGMRRGECVGLRWSDVDFNTGMLTIDSTIQYIPDLGIYETSTKTESSNRIIKLPEIALQDLRKHRAEQNKLRIMAGDRYKPQGFIFANSEGDVMHPDTLSKWFSDFMKIHSDKLPYITLHSLRHTNATLQIALGVPITTVSKRLGHANTSVTGSIYAHAIKSADDNSAEMLNNLFTNKQERTG